jgi:hypothetical protein
MASGGSKRTLEEVLAEFDASDCDQDVEFSSDDDSDLKGSGPNCVTSYITTSLSACNDQGGADIDVGGQDTDSEPPRSPQCPAQALLGLGRYLHIPQVALVIVIVIVVH